MSWRLAASLATLRREITNRWPNTTIWTIGDPAHAARASDHNPNAQGVVCAIDVVGRTQATALWNQLLASRDPRIKYLIFNRQIVSATNQPWTVRPYTGTNGHLTHLHISVGRGTDGASTRPDLYDDPRLWLAKHQEDDEMTEADRTLLNRLYAQQLELKQRLERLEANLVDVHLRPLRRTVRAHAAQAGVEVEGGA